MTLLKWKFISWSERTFSAVKRTLNKAKSKIVTQEMYIQSIHKHPDTMPFSETLFMDLMHSAQQTASILFHKFTRAAGHMLLIRGFPSSIPESDYPNEIRRSIAKRRTTKYSCVPVVNPSLATRDQFFHISRGFKSNCRHKALSEQEGRCNKRKKNSPYPCNKLKCNLCRLKNDLAVRAPYANTKSKYMYEQKSFKNMHSVSQRNEIFVRIFIYIHYSIL
jgi:hypothetical protein